MSGPVSRKTFLTSLGAAGLGAGLLRFAPAAAAQDEAGDDDMGGMMGRHAEWEELQLELYAAFTEALATELGSTADDVDAGIRKAIMTVIDSKVSDDGEGLTKGKAEALKVIVATIDVPIGPPPVFMLGMGMQMHGGGGMPGSGMGPGSGPHAAPGSGRGGKKGRPGGGRDKRGSHGKRDAQSLWPDDDGMTPPSDTAPAAPAAPAAPEGTPEPTS
ncbi:MAG: hypothetical protein QM692_10440 [Thermomicrobiales bacterium]